MRIDIRTDKETYRQGDPVMGEVTISTDEELNGDYIRLELWELVQGTGAGVGSSSLKDERELIGEFAFLPGAKQKFKFEVQLPENCRISRESSPHTHNAEFWDLRVVARSSKLKKQHQERTIPVKPAREFEAVYETCERYLKFKPIEAGDVHLSWLRSDLSIQFIMTSSDSCDPSINYLRFFLWQIDPDGIKGKVLVELTEIREKSVGAHKSLINAWP